MDVSVDEGLCLSVAVVVVDGDDRAVNGELLEIGAAMAVELGVEVGVETALEEGVLAEVDAADDVAGLEGDLFGFGEIVGGVGVEGHDAETLERDEFHGDEFGGVEEVEAEGEGFVLVDDLDCEFP